MSYHVNQQIGPQNCGHVKIVSAIYKLENTLFGLIYKQRFNFQVHRITDVSGGPPDTSVFNEPEKRIFAYI
jgi:hypothetical protein